MSSFFRNTGYAWPHTALHPQSSLEGLKALSWFQRFLNYAAGNGTDDDHATVRKKISLVQNILFCDYPDTLPAHSRKTRFNMLQTTCPCIWLQCALVRLIYTYIGMCSLELYLLITPLKSPHYSSAKPSLHPNAAPPITCWPPLHPLPFRFHNE